MQTDYSILIGAKQSCFSIYRAYMSTNIWGNVCFYKYVLFITCRDKYFDHITKTCEWKGIPEVDKPPTSKSATVVTWNWIVSTGVTTGQEMSWKSWGKSYICCLYNYYQIQEIMKMYLDESTLNVS